MGKNSCQRFFMPHQLSTNCWPNWFNVTVSVLDTLDRLSPCGLPQAVSGKLQIVHSNKFRIVH